MNEKREIFAQSSSSHFFLLVHAHFYDSLGRSGFFFSNLQFFFTQILSLSLLAIIEMRSFEMMLISMEFARNTTQTTGMSFNKETVIE